MYNGLMTVSGRWHCEHNTHQLPNSIFAGRGHKVCRFWKAGKTYRYLVRCNRRPQLYLFTHSFLQTAQTWNLILFTTISQKLRLLYVQLYQVLHSKYATYIPAISSSHSISRCLQCYMKYGRFSTNTGNRVQRLDSSQKCHWLWA